MTPEEKLEWVILGPPTWTAKYRRLHSLGDALHAAYYAIESALTLATAQEISEEECQKVRDVQGLLCHVEDRIEAYVEAISTKQLQEGLKGAHGEEKV